jgi:hypothetical protein
MSLRKCNPGRLGPAEADRRSQHHLLQIPALLYVLAIVLQRSCAHDLSPKMSSPARSWEQSENEEAVLLCSQE